MNIFAKMKKFFKTFVVIVGLLGVLFLMGGISTVDAATLNVPTTYATIQAAINAANPGDEILIANGAYSENLTITKSLTLRGASEVGVVITPVTSGYGIEVTADNVTLENFTLQNSQHYGIKVAKCTGCGYLTNLTIEEVTVQNSARSHIDLNGVQNSLINNVTVANTAAGVGIGLQNNVNVTVSNMSSTNNAWGGVGVWSTTKPDYPTAAGTNGVVIQNLQYSGVPYGLYTQATNPVLVAPTANQFVCTVISTNTAFRADIAQFVFYFTTKAEADVFATAIDGTTACQPANESTPVCEDGKMYARVNTAYDGDMFYGNQLLTPNTWFELGSPRSSLQADGFVLTFDGSEVTSMFLPFPGNLLLTIQGSIEVYGTEITNIQPISLEDNADDDAFTASGSSLINFKFTVTDDTDGGSFVVVQEDVICDEVCYEDVVTTEETTVDAVAHSSTTPLMTTTTVVSGDQLTITATGTWRSGESDDPYAREGDANGLAEYGEHEGFKFGALVGRISGGEWFLVGTSFDEIVTKAGTLELIYWDSDNTDNSGSVAVMLTKTTIQEVVCEEVCEGADCDDDTPTPSGGGAASSISSSSVGSRLLLTTGPEEDQQEADEMTLREAMDQIDTTTISACNEDAYILDRLIKLSRVPYDMVYTVPRELSGRVGADVLRAKTDLMNTLRGLSGQEQKNDAVSALVCKIEMIKQARGLRHAHIGWKSGGRTVLSDYLLQYLQDIAIMEFTK